MTENVTFEVQVQRDGNWTIHENYQGHQKDAAIAEAKKQLVEIATIEAVRVVMEVFNPDTEVFNDSVIYKDAKGAKPKKKVPTRLGGSGAPDAALRRTPRARKAKPKTRTVSLTSVVVKLLLVVLLGGGVAGLATALAEALFGGATVFGVRMVGRAETNMLVGVFLVVFLAVATVLAIMVVKGARLEKAKQSRFAAWLAARLARAAARAAERGRARSAARQDAARARAEAAAKAAADAAARQPAPVLEQPPAEPQAEPEAEPEVEPEPEAGEDGGELSPTAEKLKTYMTDFLTGSVAGSQADVATMDSFNRFGVSLYVAGACEILATTGKMDPASHARILAECVRVLGFKKSHAGSFAERYEEYLMADSRYMQMFQAGRNAINTHLTDEAAGPGLLDGALAEWNKPKQKEEQAGPVTVLFTDIAGSTAMTQELGDAGAQEVVRVHNRIVREALSLHAGREVKHTGDGIMASFERTSDGVEASIDMQRGTALHNEQNPALPLHLKIGLNAGEPIAEDNDLFGTVVQMSARIVDKASADQIFVSEVVHGICAGKDYRFVSAGGFEMKGFDGAVPLYEVVWRDGVDDQGGQPGPADDASPAAPDPADVAAPPAGGGPENPDP